MDPHGLNPPDARGAYALVLRLGRSTRLDIATLGRPVLPAGLYLYAGSAWGPGGIRARVARHLHHPKARTWHIDHLTEAAEVEEVVAFPAARECAVADLALARGARAPIPRFGASDCRTCEAHLLAVDTALVQVLTSNALAERYGIAPGDDIRFEEAGEVFRVVPGNVGRATGGLDTDARLRLFDAATERQRAREANQPPPPALSPPAQIGIVARIRKRPRT